MRSVKNKTPRGKLYAKFFNNLRALKTSGLIENKNTNVKSSSTTNSIIGEFFLSNSFS